MGLPDHVDVQAVLALAMQAHEVGLRRGLALLYVADNDNAHVGAIRAVSSLTTSLLSTMRAVGLLRGASLERFTAEMERMVRGVFDVADEHEIAHDEVVDALGRIPLAHHGVVWDLDGRAEEIAA